MAQRVADARSSTMTNAVRRALKREEADIRRDRTRRDRQSRDLFAKWDAEPLPAPWDDTEMYDENGLPR